MQLKEELRKKINEEHRHLRCAEEDLVGHFEDFCASPTTESQKQLAILFADFSSSLKSHFEFEEEGGYLATVIERRPHHGDEVERLRLEHSQILEDLERLHKDLEVDLPNNAEMLLTLKKDFRDLLTHFGRHEQKERELVMDVFWLEGGFSS